MDEVILRIKEIRRKLQFYFKFGYKIKKLHKRGKNVYVCAVSAVHGNMGDQALGYCRMKFLNGIGIPDEDIVEYTTRDKMRYWPQICKIHSKEDIIILRGGGYWGDLWLDGFEEILSYIKQFPNNNIIVFPQSVYFSDTDVGREQLQLSQKIIKKALKLTIFARDLNSKKLLLQYYPNTNIFVTPDTVLSYKPQIRKIDKRIDILLCLRNDKEKNDKLNIEKNVQEVLKGINLEIGKQDTNIDFNMKNFSEREEKLFEIWNRFAEARLIITDRLHGMIFATITGTPCIVFNNIDGKVYEQYKWIKDLGYVIYLENTDNLKLEIKKMLNLQSIDYPIEKIRKKFFDLERILREC